MITIGQAPRIDVAPIVERYLSGRAKLVQAGALDGLTKEYIEQTLFLDPGDYVLTSRLTSGEAVIVSRQKLQPLLQGKIYQMEKMGISQILLLCTGVFPGLSTTTAHLIEPDHIIPPTVKALVGKRRFGVIVPLVEQQENLKPKYLPYDMKPLFAVASPYAQDDECFATAASQLKDKVDVILLDCMGYTERMQEIVSKVSGLPVILSNALIAKLVSEIV